MSLCNPYSNSKSLWKAKKQHIFFQISQMIYLHCKTNIVLKANGNHSAVLLLALSYTPEIINDMLWDRLLASVIVNPASSGCVCIVFRQNRTIQIPILACFFKSLLTDLQLHKQQCFTSIQSPSLPFISFNSTSMSSSKPSIWKTVTNTFKTYSLLYKKITTALKQ